MKELSDIALVGLGVMGQSLALNMESKGFRVSVFNYIPEVTDQFMAERGAGKNFFGAPTYEALVASLEAPRKVFLMVTAGAAVDAVIGQLVPLLDKGDIIIDGGNSNYNDTRRRAASLEEKGLLFVGCGVSGGEEGALKGPSMMPGGSSAAWKAVAPIFQRIAAKAPDGTPCCDWIGPDGAGHFVKMVHNGIEYGDIQLICECYQIMRDGLGLSNDRMHDVFAEWNKGDLDSYLISITADILTKKEPADASSVIPSERERISSPLDKAAAAADVVYVLDRILDTAGQKGTGKWTAHAALDAGVPLPLIAEAVFARCLSSLRDDRLAASTVLAGPLYVGAAEPPRLNCSGTLSDAAEPSPSAADAPSPVIPSDRESISSSTCNAANASSPSAAGTPTPIGASPAAAAELIGHLREALLAAKIISYAQGFALMRAEADEHGWPLDYGRIAGLWRGGCIIRSVFLDRIKAAYDHDPALRNLMLDPYFAGKLAEAQQSLRQVVSAAVNAGIPAPALSSALAYYDGLRCPRLGTNLLQAQRDYFGAHTYERTDRPRGEFFHTFWLDS